MKEDAMKNGQLKPANYEISKARKYQVDLKFLNHKISAAKIFLK